ncbi:alanine--tRNA ligase [Ferruginibacter yonginensis]|uniref:Alanine--tRNA ligase n=1 Tax=Ferruginibacter yonginensis TaxID=1310416 RepID=A0ABV8QU75_9BACT
MKASATQLGNEGNTLSSAAIRQLFLDFFKSKGHTIVPSAPIVVKNDPTLLFTNAGMNQFKDYFLGNGAPVSNRIADTQKCLRVSGKHNDLEEVGVDTYHHTMFEMLGNWSFGDYFKKEAIEWSWELLTQVYKIPVDRLYVSVFEGDEKEGLPASTIALKEWQKIVAPDHIVFGNKKDNFWEMGDTGPCGPCSEIHVDMRPDDERALVPGHLLVNKDNPQVIEIWNNVFMQYNRLKDGSLQPLPAQHVDTGMGFERLVRVIQGKSSNYDTDVFSGTIEKVAAITHQTYTAGDDKMSIAFRVLADHIRAISFTIADGQLPSNTGAGYVIRRILRRAVRYYYSYLSYKQPLLFQLVPVLATQFEHVFPELQQQQDFVTKVIKEEEEAFLRTLEKGLKKMDDIIANATATKMIDGEAAFELLDTYGFPIDLTRLIAAENNITVDDAGFEKALLAQKNRSRAATALDTGDWTILKEGQVNFVGYDVLTAQTEVLRYRMVTSKGKTLYQIVLATTPFYAESGGQIGDQGTLQIGNETIHIIDTKKENDLIIHFAEKIIDDLSGTVTATVHAEKRHNITVHHSVTHLMHAALKQVLGNHVAQKGSLVNDEQLRFDFSHFAKMSDDEITAVEKIVNQKIRENIPVVIQSMAKEDAIKTGATALFGEKYGDTVRVVTIDPNYSIELCGGTHVGHTGEIGFFKIKSESAVAAGVRRIEAVSGIAAEVLIQAAFADVQMVKSLLKNPSNTGKAIETLQAENNSLLKRIESLEARQLVGIRNELLQKDSIINNVTFVGEIIEVPSADGLKKIAADLKNHLHDHVVVLGANVGGKAHVVIGISDTVVAAKNLDAGKLIKEVVSKHINGGGGGQKNLATAGGQNPSGIAACIQAVKALL